MVFDNPFYILGASLRDTQEELQSKADEKSLFESEDKVNDALTILVNAQKRLPYELDWFPGCSQNIIETIIQYFEKLKAKAVTPELSAKLNVINHSSDTIIQINLLSNRFLLLEDSKFQTNFPLVLCRNVGQAFTALDTKALLDLINADRVAARMPRIDNIVMFEEALKAKKRGTGVAFAKRYREAAPSAFATFVEELLRQTATKGWGVLLEGIIDEYQIDVLSKEEAIANQVIEETETIEKSLKKLSSDEREKIPSRVISLWNNWLAETDTSRRIARFRGLDDKFSGRIVQNIRQITISLHNDSCSVQAAWDIVKALLPTTEGMSIHTLLVEDEKILHKHVEDEAKNKVIEEEIACVKAKYGLESGWNHVLISGEKFKVPQRCVHCLKPTNHREVVSKDTISLHVEQTFPLCEKCAETSNTTEFVDVVEGGYAFKNWGYARYFAEANGGQIYAGRGTDIWTSFAKRMNKVEASSRKPIKKAISFVKLILGIMILAYFMGIGFY